MLPLLLKIRLLTSMMSAWSAAASPVPLPAEAIATLGAMRAATPVPVKLYDENLRVEATLLIGHDGSADEATTADATHLFRCRRTDREKPIARGTLKMLADLAERHEGQTIEFVSAVRATRDESWTSPHRAGRAIDFRIRGASLTQIRDYLWRHYRDVGIGWYPSEQYIHMDARPGMGDTSWTYVNGHNVYNPYWAAAARRTDAPTTPVARDPRPAHVRKPGA